VNVVDAQRQLKASGIRDDAYLIGDGHPSEAYVLTRRGAVWRVYYSERGLETGAVDFATETEACEYFVELLRSDRTAR
jgi:hypothetical protein